MINLDVNLPFIIRGGAARRLFSGPIVSQLKGANIISKIFHSTFPAKYIISGVLTFVAKINMNAIGHNFIVAVKT